MSGKLSIGQRAAKVKARSMGLQSTPRSKAKYQFKFTKVPNSLLGRSPGGKAISDGANLTLQHILRRDFEDGSGRRKRYVLASASELARARGKCTRTIRNHLKELLEKGFLSRIEGRRIYISYRRLGDLRRNFTIVPNRLLELDLPDGVILTLESLLKDGSLKLDGQAGLPTGRAVGNGARVNTRKLAAERAKSSRAIERHLSRLRTVDWQEAAVSGDKGAPTLPSIQEESDIRFHHILTMWLPVENSVALRGRKCRLRWKNSSSPAGDGNTDGNGFSRTSPSAHNTKTKTNINTNVDTLENLRRPELRCFLESPQESRRRSVLRRRFGEEAFARALRQADLQYARSPTKIRNPYGLLWTMLQDLDDTLLRSQEASARGITRDKHIPRAKERNRREEGRTKATKPEGLSPGGAPSRQRLGLWNRQRWGDCTGQGRRKRDRPKTKWERFIEEVRAERPLLAGCLEVCQHSFDKERKVLRLRGDPFVRRSLWSGQDYLAGKAGEVFGKRVRGGISIGITDEMGIAGEAPASSAGGVAEVKSKQRSRPESGEFALAGAG